MKKISGFVILILLCLCLASCSTLGIMPHLSITQTELGSKNFKVLKTGVKGSDAGFALLLGLIPISSPTYADAMKNLRSHIEMEGKSVALANITEDKSSFNLLLFVIPRIIITADIIEFIDEGQKEEEK